MSSDRTAEIWSARLQREILQLSESQCSESTINNSENEISILPSFVQMRDYKMDIEKGICEVNFEIEVGKVMNVDESLQDNERDKSKMGFEENASAVKPNDTSQNNEVIESMEVPNSVKNSIIITLDVSMNKNFDGIVVDVQNTYPFRKPNAILSAGAAYFPPHSTVSNGGVIEVDCDWTPSLHLADAALNVALKIRESIRRGDPFLEVVKVEDNSLVASLKRLVDDRTIRKERQLPDNILIGDSINLSEEPFSVCAGMYSCKAIRRPEFVKRAIAEVNVQHDVVVNAYLDEDDDVLSGVGNYMKLHAGGIRKVAGAGIVGAGSIFKSIMKSTKHVLEESYLIITDEHLIEVRSSKLSTGSAIVSFINPISFLAKLKFRRQESISLFFKQAPDDPLIYMCPDSADAVNQIQLVLKRHGVRGKHTNATTQRAIQAALNIVVDIQEKERIMTQNPSVDLVNEIMNLYRQAAEKFESSGDARHEEVMSHMHSFLANPSTASILDKSNTSVPQGEILAVTTEQLNCDDGDQEVAKEELDDSSHVTDLSFQNTMKNADDILAEAKHEMDNYGIDDDDLDKFLAANAQTEGNLPAVDAEHDAVAELDAMLNAADKELSDLMQS